MKKILVIFTGGTIGSSLAGDTIDTAPENRFRLIALYRERFQQAAQVQFDYLAPVEILSENLVPVVWTTLIKAIDEYDKAELAGIVVTHGTDTLAFSACALGFYYAGLNIPLVMVSSDYPLTDERANGLDNFDAALAFILKKAEGGVFVAYRNQGKLTQIHLGTRLASCLQLSSDFMSVQAKAYLQFIDGEFSELYKTTLPKQVWSLRPQFSQRIMLVKPYPGLNYAAINIQGVEAVLHDLYHSGTACVTQDWGEEYSLLGFIQRCKRAGVSVYLAPGVYTQACYSSTQALLSQGANMLWNISLEAAYVKLLFAYGNFVDAQYRHDFLQQNIAHEMLAVKT